MPPALPGDTYWPKGRLTIDAGVDPGSVPSRGDRERGPCAGYARPRSCVRKRPALASGWRCGRGYCAVPASRAADCLSVKPDREHRRPAKATFQTWDRAQSAGSSSDIGEPRRGRPARCQCSSNRPVLRARCSGAAQRRSPSCIGKPVQLQEGNDRSCFPCAGISLRCRDCGRYKAKSRRRTPHAASRQKHFAGTSG